jgi:hypothetical protein
VYVVECEKCESQFEIIILDYLKDSDEPNIKYCPNCGTETLIGG